MMNEEFDKRLASHIKSVFDDTDNTGADAGWLLLREQYPAKNDRKPVAWFWWLAAVILISGLGIGLWHVEKTGREKAIKRVGKAHNDSAEKRGLPQRVSHKPANNDRVSGSRVNKDLAAPIGNRKDHIIASSQLHSQKPGIHQSYKNAQKMVSKKPKASLKNENLLRASQTPPDEKAKKALPILGGDTSNIRMAVLIDGVSSFLSERISLQLRNLATNKLKPFNSDTSAQKTNPPKTRRIVYGVFAAAFYSSAAGSDNEFNLGAGLTADIPLISHLNLSTGLGIMRASLNYSLPPGSNGAQYTAITLPASVPPVLGFHNYTARLLALDIPVNLKYSFAKPYNFISAGLSSNVYLSEYYDQVYTYSPLQSGLPDSHQVTQHHFDQADLFKTFNISFGLGYPVSHKSVLIFEPFLKTPLSGLGSQKLKYSLVGFNFKLNFQ